MNQSPYFLVSFRPALDNRIELDFVHMSSSIAEQVALEVSVIAFVIVWKISIDCRRRHHEVRLADTSCTKLP